METEVKQTPQKCCCPECGHIFNINGSITEEDHRHGIPKLLPEVHAANYLGISQKHLRSLRKTGKIKFLRIPGVAKPQYTVENLMEFIKENIR